MSACLDSRKSSWLTDTKSKSNILAAAIRILGDGILLIRAAGKLFEDFTEPLEDFVSADLLFQINDAKSIQSTNGLMQSLGQESRPTHTSSTVILQYKVIYSRLGQQLHRTCNNTGPNPQTACHNAVLLLFNKLFNTVFNIFTNMLHNCRSCVIAGSV